jgi:predicted NACHT family NTPase
MPIDPLTATIATVTWIVDKYGELFVDKMAEGLASKNEKRAQRQSWEQATNTYLRKLLVEVNRLNVLGKMGQTQSLGEIYTDVNLLDELSANRRYGVPELETEFVARHPWRSEDKKRRDGLKVVAQERQLFILGKPGAGKTTFLKHIALRTIKANAQKDGDKKLPIFVTLKELSDSGQALVPFIAEQFRRADFPEAETFVYQLLKAGDAVVLLDGLDEVNQEGQQRDQMIGWIKNFVQEFDRCQILLTCRVTAVGYSFKEFTYVEMADFSPLQQKTFIFRWFENSQDKRNCWQALQQSQNETLQELARIPLLLSLLCVVFEAHKSFPAERHELYQEATQALLGDWDKQDKLIQRDSIYDGLSQQRREQLLAYIAIETFADGEYFIKEERLVGLIEDYLKEVVGIPEPNGPYVLATMEAQHGLLVERAKGIHSFSHLTLQEYFAARYIIENEVQGSLPRLMAYVGDDRWREVFLLTTVMLNDATDFIEQYLQALARLITQDEKLITILEWCAIRSANLRSDVEPRAARAFYLSCVLALGRAGSFIRIRDYNFDLDLDLYLAYDLDLDIDFDALDRSRDIDVLEKALYFTDFGLDLALNLALARDLARVLALDLTITFDPGLVGQIPDHTEDIIIQLQAWGLRFDWPLHSLLTNLIVPDDVIIADKWQKLRDGLERILLRHWDLKQFWLLSEKQLDLLAQYLDANSLLLECLDTANIPNREAVMNQMLLPP